MTAGVHKQYISNSEYICMVSYWLVISTVGGEERGELICVGFVCCNLLTITRAVIIV